MVVKLSSRKVETAKPGKYADGGNLYLAVSPTGARKWTFRFLWNGRAREAGLGSADDVTLADAREKAADYRRMVAKGVDPIEAHRKELSVISFGVYALALVDRIEGGFSNAKHRQQWRNSLKTHAKPIWDTPIDKVDTLGVLACLIPIWDSKAETARRLRGRIERVLTAAKTEKLRSGENPAVWRNHLDAALSRRQPLSKGHHAALPYKQVSEFMADLRGRDATAARALEFCILTATRTQETLDARWDEFDLDEEIWKIPAPRMKGRVDHRVPLSKRAAEIVAELAKTKTSEYVFPGRKEGCPLADMAMLMLLRRMGRSDVTPHGFRSSFSDWASEVSPFSGELRETALAHAIGNKVEAAYRRGDALKKRRDMMQAWADYCEPNAATTNVVLLTSHAEQAA
jgi:integrase